MNPVVAVSLIMDLPVESPSGARTIGALQHAIAAVDPTLDLQLIRTAELAPATDVGSGVIVGPGSPYDRPDLAEEAIRSARERGLPLVGT